MEISNCIAREEARIGCHLVVATAPGVQFAGDRANQFAQATFDGSVNIFIIRFCFKRARIEFLLDALQAIDQRIAF